jgi:hypothetical protein
MKHQMTLYTESVPECPKDAKATDRIESVYAIKDESPQMTTMKFYDGWDTGQMFELIMKSLDALGYRLTIMESTLKQHERDQELDIESKRG